MIGLIAIQDAPKRQPGIKSLWLENGQVLIGDTERVAQVIAKQVGIDTVIADVLPQES